MEVSSAVCCGMDCYGDIDSHTGTIWLLDCLLLDRQVERREVEKRKETGMGSSLSGVNGDGYCKRVPSQQLGMYAGMILRCIEKWHKGLLL